MSCYRKLLKITYCTLSTAACNFTTGTRHKCFILYIVHRTIIIVLCPDHVQPFVHLPPSIYLTDVRDISTDVMARALLMNQRGWCVIFNTAAVVYRLGEERDTDDYIDYILVDVS